MKHDLQVPAAHGAMQRIVLNAPAQFKTATLGMVLPRKVLSAAHVVCDPRIDVAPFAQSAIDMDATQRYREYLWSLGLGVAEAMDTAQRGMGLGWGDAQELIAETLHRARGLPGAVVYSGVGTDHLPAEEMPLSRIVEAYQSQLEFVETRGGRVILMASRALSASAKSYKDYSFVYREVLSAARQPLILHWLGPMFDPALAGYWGEQELERAMSRCLELIHQHADKVEGIKISLLDKTLEIEMRRRLPAGVSMFTGDDFNYPELIAGDDTSHSDALLGIFDPIAPAASAALRALSDQDTRTFRATLDPTVALAREIFRAPTQYYKTGVVFLAWLNGHQEHFTMVGGHQGARSILHLSRVFALANDCGLLSHPEMARERMRILLELHGVRQ